MPELTQFETPNGTTYDLVDAGARELIAAINNWDYSLCTNAANTPKGITWGSVTGTLEASSSTMYKIYLVPDTNDTNDVYDEYVTINTTGTTYIWELLGHIKLPDMSNYVQNKSGHSGGTAGDLAYKNSVSASYTPDGSVSLTKTNKTTTVSKASSGTATYTPSGTVSQPTFSGSSTTSTGTFTPSGSVSITATANKTATVSKASSGTATYTPSGSVSAPTISVATAGSTTTIKNPSSVTVAKTVVTAEAGATAPSNALTYWKVEGTKLTLKQLGYTTGASISTSNVTVKNGDAAYSASQPTFTGDGARLVTGNIPVPSTLSFSGDEGSVSVSGTPSGTVSQPTFTGDGARLVTGNISIADSASFSGTAATITSS